MRSLDHACNIAREALLAERGPHGHWEGELSTSALSTATAVMALLQVRRQRTLARHDDLIASGLQWLVNHQNADGGWGDTLRSHSNISTTMLCHATLTAAQSLFDTSHAEDRTRVHAESIARAATQIARFGGLPALIKRYGRDRTFSIPILTHCALAGLVDWKQVLALPFELACLPANFYKWVRLPVVSYALPALIAIGQVRHFQRRPWNPVLGWIRDLARKPSLQVLDRIQPASGGFLEATPLTSFVTMSLAAMGRCDHPVVERGVRFLEESVRPDGSWPIDTNLVTWVTTLSVNALGDDLPRELQAPIREWLLGQQWRIVHPYTNADPGGWAWTDLSGGVPDADDTPGAILALVQLTRGGNDLEVAQALRAATGWLLDLQNSDGGWPTFCRGWGTLPFDRSAPDLTAHALRALQSAQSYLLKCDLAAEPSLLRRLERARDRGFGYLVSTQRGDGAWLPLWFGNQDAPDDENPTYGTAKVLAAWRDCAPSAEKLRGPEVSRARDWLVAAQNADGGFGAGSGTVSSVEETALAVEVLATLPESCHVPRETVVRGLEWLDRAVILGTWREPSPIGFYFAKLWYFERLYPMLFCVAALRAGRNWLQREEPPSAN